MSASSLKDPTSSPPVIAAVTPSMLFFLMPVVAIAQSMKGMVFSCLAATVLSSSNRSDLFEHKSLGWFCSEKGDKAARKLERELPAESRTAKSSGD